MTFDERVTLLRRRHALLKAGVVAAKPKRGRGSGTPRGLNPNAIRNQPGRHSKASVARDYQRRNVAAGLCAKCPEPRVTSMHCDRHAKYQAALQREGRPPSRVYKCSKCGAAGHQSRTCERRKSVADYFASHPQERP